MTKFIRLTVNKFCKIAGHNWVYHDDVQRVICSDCGEVKK